MTEGTETSESSLHSSLERQETVPEPVFSPEIIASEPAYPDIVHGSAAYARLAGTGKGAIDYLVRSKVVTIGRAGCGADCEVRSDARTVSRHHATIYWVADTDSWAITCFSRSNALMVDGAPVLADAPPMHLRSRNLVEIGDAAFFFLAAVEPTARTDDVGWLEKQIEELRASRKRKRAAHDGESRSAKVARRSSTSDAGRARNQQKKTSVDGVHRNAKGYSSDDYRQDEVRFDHDQPAADTPDEMEDEREHVGLGRSRHREHRRRDDYISHKDSWKTNSSRKDDADTEDEGLSVPPKGEKPKKNKKKGLKLSKKKNNKRRGDRKRSRESEEGREEESDGAADRGNEEGVDFDAGDDGFDVAPIPSLRDYIARSGSSSHRLANQSGFREDWNKKERADFGRALFAVGVDAVYDADGNLVNYDWTRFRGIARLEKKSDSMLAEYYDRMIADVECLLEEEAREKQAKGPRTKHKPGCDCVVCENTRKSRRKKEEELNAGRDIANADVEHEAGNSGDVGGALGYEARGDGNDAGIGDSNIERVIGLVTAQKLRVRMSIHEAARQIDSAAGQNVMRKLRSQPRSAAANGELTDWWVNGVHDHALMVGVARFGVGQWNDIWADVHNPEFARARSAEGKDIEWPSAQVAMKRLREVSSSINAELRRVAKKRAKGKLTSTPTENPGPSRGKKVGNGESKSKTSRRTLKSDRPSDSVEMKGKIRSRHRREMHSDVVEVPEGEEDDYDQFDLDAAAGDDDIQGEGFEHDERTGDGDIGSGDDEEEEEIEIEIEEEEGDDEDDDDSDPNTASESE